MLHRAFADPRRAVPLPVEGGRAVELAVAYDLAPRIACRIPFEELQAELGPAAARALAVRQLAVEAWGERVVGLAKEVGGWLQRASVPVAFLKFAALRLGGHVAAGTRAATDLDVLVPSHAAAAARQALLGEGCREERLIHVSHHSYPLLTPAGVPVEVHTAVPGVRLSGRQGDATFDALLDAGLLVAPRDGEGAYLLPCHELLLAHCLAHGLWQHATAPLAYPPMRMLADLVDLGLAASAELEAQAAALVAGAVPREAVAAAAALGAALAAGPSDELLASTDDGAPRLLRHLLAGPVDGQYQRALRFHALRGLVGMAPGRLLAELRQALWLSRAQVELMHGPQRSAWGYLGVRLQRPFALCVHLVRYAGAALGHRLRTRG